MSSSNSSLRREGVAHLQVLKAPARDDRNVTVGDVGQPLQRPLGLGRNNGLSRRPVIAFSHKL
jgi:hypothetical protein